MVTYYEKPNWQTSEKCGENRFALPSSSPPDVKRFFLLNPMPEINIPNTLVKRGQ